MSAQPIKLISVASNVGIHETTVWRPRFKRMLIVALVLIAIALCLPSHYYVRTQAIAVPKRAQWVAVTTPGRVAQVLVRAGERVKQGEPLIILENKELSLQYEGALAQCAQSELFFKPGILDLDSADLSVQILYLLLGVRLLVVLADEQISNIIIQVFFPFSDHVAMNFIF